MPPGVSAEMSNVLRSSSRRTRKSRLGAEKSNPRDKRDLLDHRTACKAHFTLRKQDFKSDSLPLQNILGKLKIQIEKLRAVLRNHWFSENWQGGNFFAQPEELWSQKKSWKATWCPWTSIWSSWSVLYHFQFTIMIHSYYLYDICYMIFAIWYMLHICMIYMLCIHHAKF